MSRMVWFSFLLVGGSSVVGCWSPKEAAEALHNGISTSWLAEDALERTQELTSLNERLVAIDYLAFADADVQLEALETLLSIATKDLSQLTTLEQNRRNELNLRVSQLIPSPVEEVQVEALRMAGYLGIDAALDYARLAAEPGRDPSLRLAAVESLSRLGVREDLASLERLQKDPDADIANAALRGAGKLVSRWPAAGRMAWFQESIFALLDEVRSSSGPRRAAAWESITEGGVAAALEEPVMLELQDRMRHAVMSGHAPERLWALRATNRFHRQALEGAVVNRLMNDQDRDVLIEALKNVSMVGSHSPVDEALVRLVDEARQPDLAVREAAMRALNHRLIQLGRARDRDNQAKPDDAWQRLMSATFKSLEDSEGLVRRLAGQSIQTHAAALSEAQWTDALSRSITAPKATEQMIVGLHELRMSEDPGQSGMALGFLGSLMEASENRELDLLWRALTTRAMGYKGYDASFPWLTERALIAEDHEVRAAAVAGLGRLKTEEAYQWLWTLYQSDTSELVRVSAVSSMATYTQQESLPDRLLYIMEREPFSKAVRVSAAKGMIPVMQDLGDNQRIVQRLEGRYVREPDPEVRELLGIALAQQLTPEQMEERRREILNNENENLRSLIERIILPDNPIGQVINLIIAILGAIALIYLVLRAFRYGAEEIRALASFRRVSERDQTHDDGFVVRALRQIPKASLIGKRLTLVREIQDQGGVIDGAALADISDSQEEGRFSSSFVRYAMNAFVILGLIGTFFGVIQMVEKFHLILGDLNTNDIETLITSRNDAVDSMQSVLAGLGTALSTSIVGLTMALFIGFVQFVVNWSQNRIMIRLEELTQSHLAPRVTRGGLG